LSHHILLSFFSLLHPHPKPTLFPYTTLFRSETGKPRTKSSVAASSDPASSNVCSLRTFHDPFCSAERRKFQPCAVGIMKMDGIRSEEHTSELQSRFDLVCRLLLEKKKKRTIK